MWQFRSRNKAAIQRQISTQTLHEHVNWCVLFIDLTWPSNFWIDLLVLWHSVASNMKMAKSLKLHSSPLLTWSHNLCVDVEGRWELTKFYFVILSKPFCWQFWCCPPFSSEWCCAEVITLVGHFINFCGVLLLLSRGSWKIHIAQILNPLIPVHGSLPSLWYKWTLVLW